MITTQVVCLTSLSHDDAFSSCFCTLGSKRASRIEDDGFWDQWDGLKFLRGGLPILIDDL